MISKRIFERGNRYAIIQHNCVEAIKLYIMKTINIFENLKIRFLTDFFFSKYIKKNYILI